MRLKPRFRPKTQKIDDVGYSQTLIKFFKKIKKKLTAKKNSNQKIFRTQKVLEQIKFRGQKVSEQVQFQSQKVSEQIKFRGQNVLEQVQFQSQKVSEQIKFRGQKVLDLIILR